jgi:hypothetical protein
MKVASNFNWSLQFDKRWFLLEYILTFLDQPSDGSFVEININPKLPMLHFQQLKEDHIQAELSRLISLRWLPVFCAFTILLYEVKLFIISNVCSSNVVDSIVGLDKLG